MFIITSHGLEKHNIYFLMTTTTRGTRAFMNNVMKVISYLHAYLYCEELHKSQYINSYL
jgi:hypothetical protein